MSALHTTPRRVYRDREAARVILRQKLDAPRPEFSTYDPDFIRDDAAFRLRWIDCAPEGANHQTAPFQDKTGTPMGGTFYETVECPPKSVRERRPNWAELKTARHFASLERLAALDRELGVEGQPPEARQAARLKHRRDTFRSAARTAREARRAA